MSFKIELNQYEYKNIFELATSFKGSTATKLSALKVMEKITTEANTNAVVEGDTKTLPETITVEFTKNELEGYWKGLVGYIDENKIPLSDVLIIKTLATKLKLSKRFKALEDTIKVEEDSIPLDD